MPVRVDRGGLRSPRYETKVSEPLLVLRRYLKASRGLRQQCQNLLILCGRGVRHEVRTSEVSLPRCVEDVYEMS